ncbi:transposase [Streptomyces sp. MK5]|uniref:transposase n=1 Tax=Streptomyces sp. MK5 TaxID=3064253 RepID=UPI0035586CE0
MPNPVGHRRYTSDTTIAEWALLDPLLPVPACQTQTGGDPEKWPRRQIVDAIRCITDNDAKWRAVRSDFPPLLWDPQCQVDGVSGISLDTAVSVHEVIRRLPEISIVRDRSRAMAVLDAIMSPDWESRFYSFDSRWSPAEEMASMRDGCGNDYSIVFSQAGAYARGFDHESPMSPYRVTPPVPWPGLFDAVPEAFAHNVLEPAFSGHDGIPRVTVCFWRGQADSEWRAGAVQALPTGVDDEGSAEWLFDVLVDGRPEAYQHFAEEHYEVTADIEAIRHVYALRPLTQSVVSALNPDVELVDLADDLAQIGYPVPGAEATPGTA